MTKAAWALEDSYHFWGYLHPRPDPHATRTARMADPLYLPTHVLFDPGAPGSGVGIVDPDLLHARKLAFDWLQKQWDALPILQLGAMHHHFQQQAQRVDEQVTLPSRELLN